MCAWALWFNSLVEVLLLIVPGASRAANEEFFFVRISSSSTEGGDGKDKEEGMDGLMSPGIVLPGKCETCAGWAVGWSSGLGFLDREPIWIVLSAVSSVSSVPVRCEKIVDESLAPSSNLGRCCGCAQSSLSGSKVLVVALLLFTERAGFECKMGVACIVSISKWFSSGPTA